MVNVWLSNANILAERKTRKAALALMTSSSIFSELKNEPFDRQEATCQVC